MLSREVSLLPVSLGNGAAEGWRGGEGWHGRLALARAEAKAVASAWVADGVYATSPPSKRAVGVSLAGVLNSRRISVTDRKGFLELVAGRVMVRGLLFEGMDAGAGGAGGLRLEKRVFSGTSSR